MNVRSPLLLDPSSTLGAMFRLVHGAAPSAPVNGDMWTTTVGVYVRINGATVGPLIAGTIPTAGGAPVNVTSAAASAGVAATFSRSDHKHDITVAAAVTITPASSNGAGSASSLARSDHTHAITSAAAVGLTFVTTNTVGTAASVARSDHTHAITAPGADNGSALFQENNSLIFDNWLRMRRNIMADFWDFPQGDSGSGAGAAYIAGTPFYIRITGTATVAGANRGTAYTRNCLTPINFTAGSRCAVSLFASTASNGIGIPTNVGTVIIETCVSLNALSTATDEYILNIGATNDLLTTDGVFFEYRRTTSVNWRVICRSGGVTTATTTGTAVAVAAVRLRVEIASSTSATFYINGTSVGTITTNIPTQVFPGFVQEKTVSTGAATFNDVDYMAYMLALSTPRAASTR